jgi:hypothetical protein
MSAPPDYDRVLSVPLTRSWVYVPITGSGSSGVDALGNYLSSLENRITASYVTPNFRGTKPFSLPVNPYTKRITNYYAPTFYYVDKQSNSGGSTTYTVKTNISRNGVISGDAARASATADDPTQKVINKLIESIGTAKADAGTSMAELGKTAQHVAHTAQRIGGFLIALKKGRLGDALKSIGVTYTTRDVRIYNRRWAKAVREDGSRKVRYDKLHLERGQSRVTDLVADTWLEYSYGWKPLLSDTRAIAQATAQALVDRGLAMRYQTHKSTSKKSTHLTYNSNGVYGDMVINSVVRVAIGVHFRIPSGAISIADAFGLSNPLTVAWEVVPFSFVVDWFLPVGDALRSLTAFNGLEFHSGWLTKTDLYEWNHKVVFSNAPPSGGNTSQRSGSGGGTYSQFTLTRTKLTSFPSYGFPKWKDPRSFAHAASAVALLQSLFLRK